MRARTREVGMVITRSLIAAGLAGAALLTGCHSGGEAVEAAGAATCADLPGDDQLTSWVRAAPDSGEAGGLFGGRREWAAIVDRNGIVCAVVSAVDSAGRRWPGSRTIAMAKAFTANGFSTNDQPLSTARLYSMAQPGGTLYGAFVANPFDPSCLSKLTTDPVCGGTIIFGGGVPLYRDGLVVGGLGVSGDTPCADHEIAKRIRGMAGLVPPGGDGADDITYGVVDPPSAYTHPLCQNTYRNGQKIGDPAPHPPYNLPVPGSGAQATSPDTLPVAPAPPPADTLRRSPGGARPAPAVRDTTRTGG